MARGSYEAFGQRFHCESLEYLHQDDKAWYCQCGLVAWEVNTEIAALAAWFASLSWRQVFICPQDQKAAVGALSLSSTRSPFWHLTPGFSEPDVHALSSVHPA